MSWHTLFRGPTKWPDQQAQAAEIDMIPGQDITTAHFAGMVLRLLAHEFSPHEYCFRYVLPPNDDLGAIEPPPWTARTPLKRWLGDRKVGIYHDANPNILISLDGGEVNAYHKGQVVSTMKEALALFAWATLRGRITQRHVEEITRNVKRRIRGDEDPYCWSSRQEGPPRIYAARNCNITMGAIELEDAGWVDIYLVDGVELKSYVNGHDYAIYTHGLDDDDD